jgi:hypothetical protein
MALGGVVPLQTEDYGNLMQTMTRDNWTDERLDDLNDRVGEGFHRMDEEFTNVRREISTQGRELREEMAAQGKELREEMAAQTKELREEMRAQTKELRGEMRETAAELRQSIDSLNHNMAYGCIALCGIFLSALISILAITS